MFLRSSSPLRDYFDQNSGRLIHKWSHYFPIYERHFRRFRWQHPTVLEIGVSHGGSLDMWSDYFGPGSQIVGVDIEERCRELERPGIAIRVGDQGDPAFLDELTAEFGTFDIVIDDGSHQPVHQITSLQHLWPSVTDGGVYLVEDLHANYWSEYGGGYRREGTFIEFAKTLLDELHGRHTGDPLHGPSEWTLTLGGLHAYECVIVLDKELRGAPTNEKSGQPVFDTLYGKPVKPDVAGRAPQAPTWASKIRRFDDRLDRLADALRRRARR
jgi:hypothetical protein